MLAITSLLFTALAATATAATVRRDGLVARQGTPSLSSGGASGRPTSPPSIIGLDKFSLNGDKAVNKDTTLVAYYSNSQDVSYGKHDGDLQQVTAYPATLETFCVHSLSNEGTYLYFNPKDGQDLRARLQSIDLFTDDVKVEECDSPKTDNYIGRNSKAVDDDESFNLPSSLRDEDKNAKIESKVVGILDNIDQTNCKAR